MRHFTKAAGQLSICQDRQKAHCKGHQRIVQHQFYSETHGRACCALFWLQRCDKACQHITIAEGILDWMDGKPEAELPCGMEEDNLDGDLKAEEDQGPAPSQVANVAGRPESVMGMMPKRFEHLPKQKDNNVTVTVDQATKNGSKPGVPVVTFPCAAKEASSEHDADQRLFVKAFHWLFPRGIGDYHDHHQQQQLTFNEWIQSYASCMDGRFAMDKMWGGGLS
jgi:hypothetical protein